MVRSVRNEFHKWYILVPNSSLFYSCQPTSCHFWRWKQRERLAFKHEKLIRFLGNWIFSADKLKWKNKKKKKNSIYDLQSIRCENKSMSNPNAAMAQNRHCINATIQLITTHSLYTLYNRVTINNTQCERKAAAIYWNRFNNNNRTCFPHIYICASFVHNVRDCECVTHTHHIPHTHETIVWRCVCVCMCECNK